MDIYEQVIKTFKEQETKQDKEYFCYEIASIIRNCEREIEQLLFLKTKRQEEKMKKNYKKAFDVLLRNTALWKDRTDAEKKQIFKELNEEAGFNYYLKDYKEQLLLFLTKNFGEWFGRILISLF